MNQEELLKKIYHLLPSAGNYTYYQSFQRIGLKGQRPVEKRYKIYQLSKFINKESRVLDLGCNIGCLSLHLAEKVKEVIGVERFTNYILVGNLIKEYLNIYNCHFFKSDIMKFTTPYRFDMVLALAVHSSNWKNFELLANKIFMNILKSNGKLILEERKFKKHIPFNRYVDYLVNLGFQKLYEGKCQFPMDYNQGKLNHLRNFIVMEKKK